MCEVGWINMFEDVVEDLIWERNQVRHCGRGSIELNKMQDTNGSSGQNRD